jgi:3',5'-nucleoside bisphosphate phosphatase
MRTRPRPLLCELHAHTTWSDGDLTIAELVDLYGRSGFDVLAVTDHAIRADDPWPDRQVVRSDDFPAYLTAVESEARRARPCTTCSFCRGSS